jgi:transcription factor IIIB subunit 2
MQALSAQLKIPEATINSGVQILKLAASHNFIQGRRLDMVAAVCLYSACRKEKPCRVMLIDFADRIQVCFFVFVPVLHNPEPHQISRLSLVIHS